jgi:putative two-component system response regulator
VRRHVDAGAEMLRDDRHPRVFTAREIAVYHHARWDGAGYPGGVSGTGIPMAARVCAVADSYDAMVCGVGYREPKSMDHALAELQRGAGGQFDPALVRNFERMLREQTEDLGLDLAAARPTDFQRLVSSLQEDRGFM